MNASRSRTSLTTRSGFTLVELLVAIGILLLLSSLLVYLFHGGMKLWHTGQEKRKTYENAQFVLNRISSEIRYLWFPYHTDTKPPTNLPYLYASKTRNGDSWIEFVRTKEGFLMNSETLERKQQLQRIVYVHDQNSNILYRGTFPPQDAPSHFNSPNLLNWAPPENDENEKQTKTSNGKNSSSSSSGAEAPNDQITPLEYQKQHFEPFAEEIQYIEFHFFGPWSKSWQPIDPFGNSKGASKFWDSTQLRMKPFRLHQERPAGRTFPVAIPQMIRIVLQIAPQSSKDTPILIEEMEQSDARQSERTFVVENAGSLPKEGFGKIGDEWIQFRRTDIREIRVLKRGARRSNPRHHKTGTPIQAGQTFERVIYVPVYPSDRMYGNGKQE